MNNRKRLFSLYILPPWPLQTKLQQACRIQAQLLRDDLSRKSPLKFGISLKIGEEGFGIMKKTEILSNMTAIWFRNQTMEFLLGTDHWKFALSLLVEAENSRGGGVKKISARNRNFQVIFY